MTNTRAGRAWTRIIAWLLFCACSLGGEDESLAQQPPAAGPAAQPWQVAQRPPDDAVADRDRRRDPGARSPSAEMQRALNASAERLRQARLTPDLAALEPALRAHLRVVTKAFGAGSPQAKAIEQELILHDVVQSRQPRALAGPRSGPLPDPGYGRLPDPGSGPLTAAPAATPANRQILRIQEQQRLIERWKRIRTEGKTPEQVSREKAALAVSPEFTRFASPEEIALLQQSNRLGQTMARTETAWARVFARPDSRAEGMARQAFEWIAGGRLQQADDELTRACPALRANSLVDLPEIDQPSGAAKKISAHDCFRALALVRSRRMMASSPLPDPVAFEAAQQATESDASTALAGSAARHYAARFGADGLLDEMAPHIAAMAAAGQALFHKWTFDRMQRTFNSAAGFSRLVADMEQTGKKQEPHILEIDRLTQLLDERAKGYFELRSPTPIPLAELMPSQGAPNALLRPGEALVLWMTAPDDEKGLVFALSADGKGAWAPMTLTGKETSKRVQALRRQIDPCSFDRAGKRCWEEPLQFDRRAAWELHQSLLGDPRIAAIVRARDVDTLLIVPSDVLTSLPPALLIETEPTDRADDTSPDGWRRTDWLIRGKSIAVLPSVSSLRVLRVLRGQAPVEAPAPAGKLYMFANPRFAAAERGDGRCSPLRRSATRSLTLPPGSVESRRAALAKLAPLPCTLEEGEQLRKLLGGRLYTDQDARESRLRQAADRELLAGAEVVAFATHGLLRGDLGLDEPGLALAAPLAGDGDDDGVLTASEIALMKLRANVVLLSACNTADPGGRGARGISGLARAFFQAGARSLVASHWRVDDVASARLTTEMMRSVAAGSGKAQAMKAASLKMLDSNDDPDLGPNASHPVYWAPFTVIGEPG